MFSVIKQFNELKALLPALDVVYQKHQSLSFYSPAYILNAYEQFLLVDEKNQLFFISYQIKGEIVNYVPLYIDAKQTLRFIFDIHTDYCACIGPDLNFGALKDLAKLLLEEPNVKRLEFENLLPNDQILNSFKHFLGLGAVITCYNNHSFVSKSQEIDFFAHLKSNQKSELKRVQKKNEAYPFEVFDGSKPLPVSELKQLRAAMIANKSRDQHFFDDAFFHFAQLMYAAGELEVFSKWDGTSLISASMVLKNKQYRMVWIDLYADVQFVNLSAYVDYINYLQQFPELLFSFGRGSYDYKAKNFQPQLQNLYNLRYSKSKFSPLFSHYQGIKQFVKRLVKERK